MNTLAAVLAGLTLAVRKIPSFMNRSPGGWHRTYPGSWKKSIEPMRWSQRMGIITHQGLRYGHNIGRIINPEKVGKTHPHFFPMYNGKRFIPPPSMKRPAGQLDHWEPCYTAEDIVEEGAKQVIDHFDAHPDQRFFAFGINDSTPICQSRGRHRSDRGRTPRTGDGAPPPLLGVSMYWRGRPPPDSGVQTAV